MSEDATDFTLENLTNYNVIVFLNTTGNLFDENQKDFLSVFNESFIKLTNECIYNLMYNSDYFRDSIKNLSETTFKNMNETEISNVKSNPIFASAFDYI